MTLRTLVALCLSASLSVASEAIANDPTAGVVHRVYISKASGMPMLETATGTSALEGVQSATIRFDAYDTGNDV